MAGVNLHNLIYEFDNQKMRVVKAYNGRYPVTLMSVIGIAFREPDYETRKVKNEDGEMVLETETTVRGRLEVKRYPKESNKSEEQEKALLLQRMQTHYMLGMECDLTPEEIKITKAIIQKQIIDPLAIQQVFDYLDKREKMPKEVGDTLTYHELYEKQSPIDKEISIETLKDVNDPVELKKLIKNILILLGAETSEIPQIQPFIKEVKE